MARNNRNYTEHEVLQSVLRKSAITQPREKGIVIPEILYVNVSSPNYKGDVGNGTKGKLSFLKNYCGYSIIWK